ncbi:NusA-like transcription termination signal-binding factor [Candidatus Woesearchaeota archaeon]|nr:NusA-like transcription termination signal-binding factor [Candidatus Woesearchaeota archaeon]
MKIKYDADILKYMSLFESLTRSKLKDCIVNERVLFVVEPNEIGKAIGKNGSNVHRLEGILNKKIRIVEFNPDVCQFVRNMLYPLQATEVNEENSVVTISGPDTKTKGLMIGRDAKNLNFLKDIVKRYFEVEDIKVV